MRLTKSIRRAATALILITTPLAAQEFYLGQIQAFGFNFCPRGWVEADGSLMQISQNQALFALFGTIYGGDGRTTFGLPDLRGAAMVGAGSGDGIYTFQQGQRALTPPLGSDSPQSALLAIKFCVNTFGLFPSRN